MFIGVVGIKGLRFVGVIFTEKRKGAALLQPLFLMAEEQGFEPWVPCDTSVFKTGAFDHSAIPPINIFGGPSL